LGFHVVAVVGRLVKNRKGTEQKRYNIQDNTRTIQTQNRKQKYTTKNIKTILNKKSRN
jgi:hypothetical protein